MSADNEFRYTMICNIAHGCGVEKFGHQFGEALIALGRGQDRNGLNKMIYLSTQTGDTSNALFWLARSGTQWQKLSGKKLLSSLMRYARGPEFVPCKMLEELIESRKAK